LSARACAAALPSSALEAATRLQEIASLDRRQLRACERTLFLRGWFALFYVFPGLHPDNALDHGNTDALWSPEDVPLPGLDEFATYRFARSGWPVALESLGREAWRRYDLHELSQDEFYCRTAQRAGMGERAKSAMQPSLVSRKPRPAAAV
jgi:DNA (cytosine-5)-methyltransferase 1